MTDEGKSCLQLGDDIALAAPDMIAIKHQFEVGSID